MPFLGLLAREFADAGIGLGWPAMTLNPAVGLDVGANSFAYSELGVRMNSHLRSIASSCSSCRFLSNCFSRMTALAKPLDLSGLVLGRSYLDGVDFPSPWESWVIPASVDAKSSIGHSGSGISRCDCIEPRFLC
jgi:hypothetical protein